MSQLVRILGVGVLAMTLAAACASDKGPAETALRAAEQAVTEALGGDAGKLVPDDAKTLQAALAAAKAQFDKGEYKAALAAAQALPAQATALKTAVAAAAAKQAELAKTWEALSAGLPKVVDAIKSRVDILSSAKKLPASITADKLAQAKSGLAALTADWTQATEAAKGGNFTDAVAKATAVKTKAAEVLGLLGMPVPDALKG